MSSRISINEGIRSRVMAVAKRIPNPSEIAMGIRKRACREVSIIMEASIKKSGEGGQDDWAETLNASTAHGIN